jgi:hypothetical protein
MNVSFKYMQMTTNLLDPEFTDSELRDDFTASQDWVTGSLMIINLSKTNEIVSCCHNLRMVLEIPSLLGTKQIKKPKLLGVIFSNTPGWTCCLNIEPSYMIKRFGDSGQSRS